MVMVILVAVTMAVTAAVTAILVAGLAERVSSIPDISRYHGFTNPRYIQDKWGYTESSRFKDGDISGIVGV